MNQLYKLGLIIPAVVLLAFLSRIIGFKAAAALVIGGGLLYLVVQ